MILSVHATFGAAVASLVPTHPVEAFAFGFISHLALDAIPHRDYDLISIESAPGGEPKLMDAVYRKFRLLRDITIVSFDALIGLFLAFLFFFNPTYPWIFLLGAIGAMLPDFMTFMYLTLKHKALGLFFSFHFGIMHSKVILKLSQIKGVLLQFITIAILILIMFAIKNFLLI